jgi:hypothetical protein
MRRSFSQKIFFILLINLCLYTFAEEVNETAPIEIAVLPFFSSESSRVIPMLAERLFIRKLEGTGAYRVLDRDRLIDKLTSMGIPIPDPDSMEEVIEAAREAGIDRIVYGTIQKRGSLYEIQTELFDGSTGERTLVEQAEAVGIEDLDFAAERLTRAIGRNLLPEPIQAQVEKQLDDEATARQDASSGDSLAEISELARTDPDAALERLEEPAREAIRSRVKEEVKEEARKEVVTEEIQKLYEEEKETERQRKIRLWQFWSNVGFTGLDYWASVSGAMALNRRFESTKYWGSYMLNLYDPYRSYEAYYDEYRAYRGFMISYYLSEGIAAGGKAAAQLFYRPENFGVPSGGRKLYATSLITKSAADLGFYTAAAFGFGALRSYNEYQSLLKTDNFIEQNEVYEEYRSAYNWYRYGSIGSYALLGAGAATLTFALLADGESEPIARSGKARFFTILGQSLSAVGNVSSGIALSYRAKMEEQWISEKSDPFVPEDVYQMYQNRFLVWSGITLGMWLAGLSSQLYALNLPSSQSADSGVSDEISPVSFYVVPVPGGMQAVLGVSW